MKAYGLCDRGIIPHFCGTMEHLDPDLYTPYLDPFRNDPNFPDAVLLEYISGAEPLSRTNYTRQRMDKFMEYLEEIHSTSVFHGDIHPRNMWIFPESVDRVMWVDFNRAQTYNEHQLTQRQQDIIAKEATKLAELGDDMVRDNPSPHISSYAAFDDQRIPFD